MIFVDSSALVAMLVGEADSEALAKDLDDADGRYTSPVVMYETVLALVRLRKTTVDQAMSVVTGFLERCEVAIIDLAKDSYRTALDAHDKFGKGTGHPAQLNMGDCFSYAMAKPHGARLLYKGNDFAHTDLT